MANKHRHSHSDKKKERSFHVGGKKVGVVKARYPMIGLNNRVEEGLFPKTNDVFHLLSAHL